MSCWEPIIADCSARFHLLNRLQFNTLGEQQPVPLLPFLGLVLAVMDSPDRTPVCFVLPRKGDIARLAAVLFSVTKFSQDFSKLAASYLSSFFEKSEFVRICPGGHVYNYGGYEQDGQDYFWLDCFDATGGRRRLRTSEFVARIEKTTCRRPIGHLNTPLHNPPTPAFDILLGTKTYGNLSIINNEVLLLDSQSGFENFVDSSFFKINEDDTERSIKAVFPFGQLSDLGFVNWNGNHTTGNPLVAVTHSPQRLANYCIELSKNKLVAVNGITRFKNNIQSYDDISENSKMVMFADPGEDEMIHELGHRGVRFWYVKESELSLGCDRNENKKDCMFENILRWAHNNEILNFYPKYVKQEDMDDINLHINTLIRSQSNRDVIDKILSVCWKIFINLCSLVSLLNEAQVKNFNNQISKLQNIVNENTVWLTNDDNKCIRHILEKFIIISSANSLFWQNKWTDLCEIIDNAKKNNNKYALIVRNENNVNDLKSYLHDHGLVDGFQAYSPSTYPDDVKLDLLICVSWLGEDSMHRIISKCSSPNVIVLCYSFEANWLSSFVRKLKKPIQVNSITSEDKWKFFGERFDPETPWPGDVHSISSSGTEIPVIRQVTSDFDVSQFEERMRAVRKGTSAEGDSDDLVAAHYVSFVGDSYAFLTDTHKIVVATSLVAGHGWNRQSLPERLVGELIAGDFIAFPSSGGRDLIQETADRLIGDESFNLRQLAHQWKNALTKSGLHPESFLEKSKQLGRRRHIATIKNWFADTNQIGPRDKDDLLIIALVTGDMEFESEIDNIWSAIERLRSSHLSAGTRLREVLKAKLPQVIGQVQDNGTKLDLGDIGSAWIVQVDSIQPTEMRARGDVNRLLWE